MFLRRILGGVLCIILITSCSPGGEVAGIALPDEDDVLVQILLDEMIPMEERTELINETLFHIYPPTLPDAERSGGLMRLVKMGEAPCELRYLAAATMVENGLFPLELGSYLIEESGDDQPDAEWLSHCLRLMDSVYPHMEASAKHRAVNVLVGRASRERGELAGTALLALWRISTRDSEVLPALRTLTRALLSTKSSDEQLMIAALQVASDLGDMEALPIAKRVAFSDRYGIRLRLAGVHCLGSLADEPTLEEAATLFHDQTIGKAARKILSPRQ